MEIESLQIKRVIANWNTHQTYSPLKGEYVLIDLGDNKAGNPPKTLVLGTGNKEDTLSKLIASKECVVPFIVDVDNKISALNPTTDPTPIGETSDLGDEGHFAFANHKHKLEKSTLDNVLGNDEMFGYHRIAIGTEVPDNSVGKNGDIFIKLPDGFTKDA